MTDYQYLMKGISQLCLLYNNQVNDDGINIDEKD